MNGGSKTGRDAANSMTAAGEGRSADPLPPMPLKSLQLIAGATRGRMQKTCRGHQKPSNDGAMRMRVRTKNLVLMDNCGPIRGGDWVAQVSLAKKLATTV